MQVMGSSPELTTNNEVVLLSLTIINLSVNKPLPSECAASFEFPPQILSSAFFFFSAKSSWFTPKHKQQVEMEKRRINWKSTGRGQGLGNCHSGSMFFPSEWHFIGTDPTFTGVSGTICATDLLQHLVRGPWLAIPSSALGHRLQPSFKGNARKSSQQFIQTFLILQGAWTKLMFYFYAWKVGRKQHTVGTLILCSFMSCLKSWGLTSAGENVETPPGLCGCLPAGDRLLPLLLSASPLADPRRARNQSPGHGTESNKTVSNIKLQQENEHVWVWTYWWMEWVHNRAIYFF